MYIAQRSNFASFMPFRSSKDRSLPNNFDLISRSFDENVLRRLKSLTPISTDSPSFISLSWLSQAVDFLSSTHAEAQELINNLRSSSDDTMSSYLDGSVKILDVCNSISSEVERLRQRRLCLKFVLQLLEFPVNDHQLPAADKLRRSRDLLADWENKPSRKRRTFDFSDSETLIRDLAAAVGSVPPPRGKISNAGQVIRRSIYAVGVLTVFVAGVAVAALCRMPDETALVSTPPSDFLWAESLKDLQAAILKRRFFEGEKKAWSIKEVDDVEKRVSALRDVLNGVVDGVKDDSKADEKLEKAVKELEAAMGSFSDGLDRLADGVNGLFRRVLFTRNGMVEKYINSLEQPSCEQELKCKKK